MGSGCIHRMRRGAGPSAARRACAVAACAAALGASPAAAASPTPPAYATAPAQAAILTPGTIAKTADMTFGTITQPVVAGTVVMSASATPTCTVSAGMVHIGACQSAAFSVLGKKNQRVRLKDTNNGAVTLTGPAGATMQLTNLTIATSGLTSGAPGAGGFSLGSYTINTNTGFAAFWLGGTLHVAALQAAGTYTGTINLQAVFN